MNTYQAPPYIGENNLAKNRYSRPKQLLRNPDAIIIGSGIGGLATASIFAQRKKWRVLVLEASPIPGGCTKCWEWDGYEWNTGVDSIGDMNPAVGRGVFRPTMDYITGGNLQWFKIPDPHEYACIGGDLYEWHSDPEKNIAWVEERFPGEGHKARKYYELEAQIEKYATAWGVTKVLPDRIPESIRERIYRLGGGLWREYMGKTTLEVLCGELGFSDKLAAVFSYMYGNHGCIPAKSPFAFHAVNMFHFRYGAYYPVGGPAQFANCIVPIIEAAGGQMAVNSPVGRILVEDDAAVGVELETGETNRAPVVISDAGAYGTFMELLDRNVAERFGYAEKMNQIRPSVAHLYYFMGYDEPINMSPKIVWHLPAYDIEKFDAGYKQDMDLANCMGGYMLSPSARDPVYQQRYPNKSTILILNEIPYKWIERSRQDPEFKTKFEADMEKYLQPILLQHYPELRGKTPAFKRAGFPYFGNPRAWECNSLGLEPSGDRFVKHTHWLRPQTKIRNLYLCGQDSFSPGISGSMYSSRIVYSVITNNWVFSLRKGIGSWI